MHFFCLLAEGSVYFEATEEIYVTKSMTNFLWQNVIKKEDDGKHITGINNISVRQNVFSSFYYFDKLQVCAANRRPKKLNCLGN